jgi:hypothetical protein
VGKFVLHKDVIESASSGINTKMFQDQTCIKLMKAVYERDHKLIVSREVRKKYKETYRHLLETRTPIIPIMPVLLSEIFVASNKVIDLRDSLDQNPELDECENRIINLALDDRESVIVTQNEEFITRIKNIHGTNVCIINPIQALGIVS